MNIPGAIEFLEAIQADFKRRNHPDAVEATQLGIEALKRVKAQRGPLGGTFDLGGAIGALGLPGETE